MSDDQADVIRATVGAIATAVLALAAYGTFAACAGVAVAMVAQWMVG